MSSLWTPEGEHPVGHQDERAPGPVDPEEAAAQADLDRLRQQLAETPVDVVIANHAFGLFELAALHLSLQPPRLDQARLAIDALGALTEGLTGRLGEAEATLRDGLAQLQLAFVQIQAATPADGGT